MLRALYIHVSHKSSQVLQKGLLFSAVLCVSDWRMDPILTGEFSQKGFVFNPHSKDDEYSQRLQYILSQGLCQSPATMTPVIQKVSLTHFPTSLRPHCDTQIHVVEEDEEIDEQDGEDEEIDEQDGKQLAYVYNNEKT